ncbi:hypothetical protein [Thermaerobacillus caldiproteolyticus]|uniref:hypothetical protein n=1 Tax=Thermaerobacillus caldiproteolyticus TaxID=247480 RepID=UPI00188CEA96|nr:hypothetical protein [Anoxybacillus caldiproteolyticus]QPA30419.1 hypothetical protein ISX45_12390 [Anoxybacillus caldiproteolyticus]
MEKNDALLLFLKISLHRMYEHYLPKLLQALQVLSREELWMREAEGMNAIGGIVLHICEHIRRNTLQSKNLTITFSKGIEEYFPDFDWTSDKLCEYVQKTFDEWQDEMIACIANFHHRKIDVHRLYHLVEHTAYHLGQVIDRVKRIKEISFHFCQKGLNEQVLREMIEKN